MLNKRLIKDKVISASLWNGKDKFKKKETEEERNRRDKAWQRFLGEDDEGDEEESVVDNDNKLYKNNESVINESN